MQQFTFRGSWASFAQSDVLKVQARRVQIDESLSHLADYQDAVFCVLASTSTDRTECFRPSHALTITRLRKCYVRHQCRGGDTNINEAIDGNVKLPGEWEDAVPRTSRHRALSGRMMPHASLRMHGWSSSQMIQAGTSARAVSSGPAARSAKML